MPHLIETLPKNIADNEDYENAKFLILDYNSSDGLAEYMEKNYSELIKSGRVVFYRYLEPGPFRMAHAKNMAHRLGMMEGADILCNLDADNFTGRGFASYINFRFESAKYTGNEIILWSRMNEWVNTGKRQVHAHQEPDGTMGAPVGRGCTGRIVVSSRAFLKAGGYNEKYNTWGPDDKDFNFRVKRLGYDRREIEGLYLKSVPHSDKMRFKEYPEAHADAQSYEFQSIDNADETIANFGNFGCGVVYRNFSLEPIELKPLPTRIFGIGLHKTATTSLHAALQTLGYESAHWKSVRWAKRIWEEMQATGKSRTVEKHYALSDLPIPLLYKELDRAYPGSKFILTLRNEQKWIDSVHRHWGRANHYRDTWRKQNSFPIEIHSALYGQPEFDAELFLRRYRQHTDEVLNYFKHRPQDLIVMNMDHGAGWDALCRFLGHSLPDIPYPKKFVTDQEYVPEYQI